MRVIGKRFMGVTDWDKLIHPARGKQDFANREDLWVNWRTSGRVTGQSRTGSLARNPPNGPADLISMQFYAQILTQKTLPRNH
jgi:hypothetical protein